MAIDIHRFVQHGYGGVVVAALVERLGLPLLLTPVIVAAGMLAATGELELLPLVTATTLAILLGDALWFALGRRQGSKVINFLCRVSLSKDSCVRKTQVLTGKHADISLLYSKWLPGVAHLSPPMAGNSGMSLVRFTVFNSIGTFGWVLALALGGWLSARPLEWTKVGAAIFGFLPLWLTMILVGNVAWKYAQKRRFTRALRADRIAPRALAERLAEAEDERPVVLDLRHPLDVLHDPRTIPGALNVLPEEIEQLALELELKREIALVCT